MNNCQQLLEGLGQAILMLDSEGYIQYITPATTEITGFTEVDLLKRHISIFYIDDRGNLKASAELELAAKKGAFSEEGWKAHKHRKRFWAEIVLNSLRDVQGNIEGYSCAFRDVTERKKEEMRLRESEERYRLMVECVREYSIIFLDTNGCIVTCNEGTKRIKGYSQEELEGKHFSIFYTAEDLKDKKPERELETAIATGKYEEEGWRVKKNGSVFWASVVLTALYNDQNELVGYAKVTNDITERRENEDTLRQSEERYRSLVQQVTDYGIFMMDEKGRIISWNEGAKKINGYEADEIIGKYFSIFYTDEDKLKRKPANELRIARKEGKYEEEGWRIRKDGSSFWASVVITPVYNSKNNLIGFSKVAKDLTERKASEKALKDSYERYRMLTTELKIINNELSDANKELEQFTSIVSHDLQEPIRTINSFLQLIDMKLDDKGNEELKNYIAKSIGAAKRMRELIRKLLHYAQLSKEDITQENVNVDELISQSLQNLNTTVDLMKAEIVIENEVGTVRGDSVQLLQLMQNLLSNAIKFTDANCPVIKIKAVLKDGIVTFAVSDNGIGIAREDQEKIFEIFRRLDTKKDYPGTGIGLAICKKIVDRHKGRIWTESEPGKGTTFYFTLNEEKQENLQAT